MNKLDIIKTYIFEPNYYKHDYTIDHFDLLKIFYNYEIYILFYTFSDYLKIKKIKHNYIIYSYFTYDTKRNFIDKIKNYDNTKIDIINGYKTYNCDLKISNNTITKKIDKDIYIIYYLIKEGLNIRKIKHHYFFNSKYYYNKYYNTYYINYFIIIYNKNNINIKLINIFYIPNKLNTIFCNISRNFMLII